MKPKISIRLVVPDTFLVCTFTQVQYHGTYVYSFQHKHSVPKMAYIQFMCIMQKMHKKMWTTDH